MGGLVKAQPHVAHPGGELGPGGGMLPPFGLWREALGVWGEHSTKPWQLCEQCWGLPTPHLAASAPSWCCRMEGVGSLHLCQFPGAHPALLYGAKGCISPRKAPLVTFVWGHQALAWFMSHVPLFQPGHRVLLQLLSPAGLVYRIRGSGGGVSLPLGAAGPGLDLKLLS